MADSAPASNQQSSAHPTHSVSELAAELQKVKRTKIWWWQRDDILKARMSTVVMAWILVSIVLSLYLALLLTHRLTVREIHIVLIMLLLLVTLFFFHSLLRLFLATIHPPHQSSRSTSPSTLDIDIESQPRNPNRTTVNVTFIRGPGGYAIPAAPIPIAFPDVEIDGAFDGNATGKSPTAGTTLPPPAYGLWRSSVRVNPDQFFWVRRGSDDAAAAATPAEMDTGTPPPPLPEEILGRRSMAVAPVQAVYRPPSYSSDDGVEYVLRGPRLAGTAVLAAHASGPVTGLGIDESEVVELDGAQVVRESREQQEGPGGSSSGSREHSPSGLRRLA